MKNDDLNSKVSKTSKVNIETQSKISQYSQGNIKTSLFGSEHQKHNFGKQQFILQQNSDYYIPKPTRKQIIEYPETSLWGHEEIIKKQNKKKYEIDVNKPTLDNQEVLRKQGKKTWIAQESHAFEFINNPCIQKPVDYNMINNVVLKDDRYSQIRQDNKDFARHEKDRQEKIRQQNQIKREFQQQVKEKAYAQLRQKLPQDGADYKIVDKIKQEIFDKNSKLENIAGLNGVEIRNPITLQLYSKENLNYQENFPIQKPYQGLVPMPQSYIEYVAKGNEPKPNLNNQKRYLKQQRNSTNFNDYSDSTDLGQKLMDRKKQSQFSEKYKQPSEEKVHVQTVNITPIQQQIIQQQNQQLEIQFKKNKKGHHQFNEKYFERDQAEREWIPKNKSIGNRKQLSSPDNFLLHDPNVPIITQSELAKRSPIILKQKINQEEYKLNKITNADKMSQFINNRHDDKSQNSNQLELKHNLKKN